MVCHSLRLPNRSECFDAVPSVAGKFSVLPVTLGQTSKGSKAFSLFQVCFLFSDQQNILGL